MKRSNILLQTILFLFLFLISTTSINAFSAGGVAKASLSPASSNIPIDQTSTVKVMFNTSGSKISGISLKLSFSSTNNDLELVSAVKDVSSGLTFPFEPVVTKENSVTTIVIEAIDFSTTGYSNNTNTPLATLTLKANSSFTGKLIQFNQADSKVLDKADAKDILGSTTNGTYSTTTVTITPTTTITTTPTTTVTITPTITPTTTPTTTITTTPTIPLITASPTPGEDLPKPTALPDTGLSLPGLGILSGGVLAIILGLLFIF